MAGGMIPPAIRFCVAEFLQPGSRRTGNTTIRRSFIRFLLVRDTKRIVLGQKVHRVAPPGSSVATA